MGLKEIIIEECNWENFLLEYKCPGKFVKSEFGIPRLYALWRIIWMAYHIAAIVTSGFLEQFYATSPENRVKWFIFLTNWAFTLLTVTTIIDFCCTAYVQGIHPDWLQSGEKVERLPWYLKTLWMCSNIANSMSITITIAYWTSGIFDPTKGLSGYRVLPFLGHGMNTIYIVCNLCVTAMPIRLLHCWQPFLFTVIYGVFNVIYISIGATDDMDHPYIYPPIDWRKNPIKAEVFAIGMAFGVIIVHIALFFFHLLRKKVAETCVSHVISKTRKQECEVKGKDNSVSYGSTS